MVYVSFMLQVKCWSDIIRFEISSFCSLQLWSALLCRRLDISTCANNRIMPVHVSVNVVFFCYCARHPSTTIPAYCEWGYRVSWGVSRVSLMSWDRIHCIGTISWLVFLKLSEHRLLIQLRIRSISALTCLLHKRFRHAVNQLTD